MPKNEYICDCTVVHKESVQKALQNLPKDAVLVKSATFFKVIGDRTRFTILVALAGGELCVCDLANVLSMTKSAVSHQLATLRENGFVRCRRDGKTVYYSLADDHVRKILEAGMIHVQE